MLCVSHVSRGSNSVRENPGVLEKASPYREEEWKKGTVEPGRAVYSKGESIVFMFNYTSPTLEVKAILEHSEPERLVTLSIGNSGFPFEPLMAKPRYQALLKKIDKFIKDTGIAVEEVQEEEHPN